MEKMENSKMTQLSKTFLNVVTFTKLDIKERTDFGGSYMQSMYKVHFQITLNILF